MAQSRGSDASLLQPPQRTAAALAPPSAKPAQTKQQYFAEHEGKENVPVLAETPQEAPGGQHTSAVLQHPAATSVEDGVRAAASEAVAGTVMGCLSKATVQQWVQHDLQAFAEHVRATGELEVGPRMHRSHKMPLQLYLGWFASFRWACAMHCMFPPQCPGVHFKLEAGSWMPGQPLRALGATRIINLAWGNLLDQGSDCFSPAELSVSHVAGSSALPCMSPPVQTNFHALRRTSGWHVLLSSALLHCSLRSSCWPRQDCLECFDMARSVCT